MTHDEPQMLLLVEDNPADVHLISTALSYADSQQFTLVHVERLSVALSWLEKKQFAVILLDLSLPDSWGLDTIKQIQPHAPHVPVVVMTGSDDEELAIKALQEGAQDYLVKGQVEAHTLMRALRYAIERHRLREELQASEKRYYNLFENASDALLSFTLEGIVTDVNHQLEALVGYSREEIIKQHYSKLFTSASTTMIEERLRCVPTEEHDSHLSPIMELEVVRKDNVAVPVEVRDNILNDAQGQPIGVFVMARDISARKALEQQRAEFLAMLTHDIKNPLTALIGYTDYLLATTAKGDFSKHGEVLPWMKSNAFTILSLANNYLDLSRIEDKQLTLDKKLVDLHEILSQIGQQYAGEARHREIAFEVQLQKQPCWIEGDRLALERIFTNLIHNSLKFTPKRGQITLSSVVKHGEIVVMVADTGPGIAPAEIPMLFQKYRRAPGVRRPEGTGLGLFIVKTLVEAHQGRIEVESTLGAGACFRVFLPLKAL